MSLSPASYRVQVLDRACDILECLAGHGSGLRVSEITVRLGLSKSTVHRLLSALEYRDYVRRVSLSGKYRLGIKLMELRQKAGDADGLVRKAGAHLSQLVAETAHLGSAAGR
jgi:IclR family KDG regulon transcriptional repressor